MNSNIVWQNLAVGRSRRAEIKKQHPCLLWFTGLSGSDKSTFSDMLEQRPATLDAHTYLLDGDNVRHGLCRGFSFSAADRTENIRRVGEVGKLMVDAGLVVLTAFISPFRSDRDMVRALMLQGELIEIFVDAPLEECERRDPKGLYRKARSGQLSDFTGIDSPYEPPLHPEVHLETARRSAEACADQVIAYLAAHGFVQVPRAVANA